MKEVLFPYEKNTIRYVFQEDERAGILTSSIQDYSPEAEEAELIQRAMENPIGSQTLGELAKGKAIFGKTDVKIAVIPDGVAVVVR